MGSLINRYCRSGRCESQYFVEEGADRTDGKTKIYTFKEGVERIKEIGKDDEIYVERKVEDRGINGIVDWGYNMYGIFLIDADEVEDWKDGTEEGNENIAISDKTLNQFELLLDNPSWINSSRLPSTDGLLEELMNYLGYDEEEDHDIESLREQASDICNEDEEQDPDIERDFANAEIVK